MYSIDTSITEIDELIAKLKKDEEQLDDLISQNIAEQVQKLNQVTMIDESKVDLIRTAMSVKYRSILNNRIKELEDSKKTLIRLKEKMEL